MFMTIYPDQLQSYSIVSLQSQTLKILTFHLLLERSMSLGRENELQSAGCC